MGRGLSISFDLDGTLTDPAFVDGVWNEGLPRILAEHQGIDYQEACRLCRDAYCTEGESSIRWYQLSYWLNHFDLHHVDEATVISGFTPESASLMMSFLLSPSSRGSATGSSCFQMPRGHS